MGTLEDENKDLRYEIDQQLSIIESQKQELHDAHRKIDCLNHMKVEMEIEIDALTGLQQINGNLEMRVKTLEADLNSAKEKCDMLDIELQAEKQDHEKLVSEMKEEITILRNEHLEEQSTEKTDQLISKLNCLEDTNNALISQNQILQNENKSLSEKTLLLELSLNEKNQHMDEMKNMLETKSNDLKSALKLVDELQEEKALLSSELLTIKTCPTAGDKRGNSLFAEVDDKRQSVAQKLDAMHRKYKELKKNFIKKNSELRTLEVENIELKKKFNESEKSPYESMATLLESYKIRIQDLTHRVSQLEKRPENPQIISISEITSSNYDSLKTLVDNERKAYRELTAEMEKRSLRELAQGEELFKLKQEVRILIAKKMMDEAKIGELTLKLQMNN